MRIPLPSYAVVWTPAGSNEYGEITVNSPQEIRTRWEIGKSLGVGDETESVAYDAEIWVENEWPLGTIVWRGKLVDLPSSPTGLYEVIDYIETPDLKGRIVERRLLLRRYTDQLPTVVP